MPTYGYEANRAGSIYWYRTPKYRILSAPAPIGRGTYPFDSREKGKTTIGGSIDPGGPYEPNRPWDSTLGAYYFYYQSSLRARFNRQGVSMPGYLEADWDEHPSYREKVITRRAFDEIADYIDYIRTQEGASAFNWTASIDPYYIGPLSYRNQIAAALEVWNVKTSVFDDGGWSAWPNIKEGVSDPQGSGGSWAQACENLLADSPTASSLLTKAMRFYGSKSAGSASAWLASAMRWNIQIENESADPLDYDLLPDSVSDTVLQIELYLGSFPEKWDDWSRAWSIALYSCDAASYDANRTLVAQVAKGNIPAFAGTKPNERPQIWLSANVDSYIDLTEDVANYFTLTFTHDELTSVNGSFNFPPDPGEGNNKSEGVYVNKVRLLQYVDSIPDIGSTA